MRKTCQMGHATSTDSILSCSLHQAEHCIYIYTYIYTTKKYIYIYINTYWEFHKWHTSTSRISFPFQAPHREYLASALQDLQEWPGKHWNLARMKIWKVEGKAPNMRVLNHELLFFIWVIISSKMNLISRLYRNMSFPSRRNAYRHDKYL